MTITEGKQRALRRCLERATGDLIYLADADTLFEGSTVWAVLDPLLRGEAEAATGTVRPLPELARDPFAGYQHAVQAYGVLWAGAHSSGLHGANCAVTRRALLAAGGFGGDAPTGTDYELAQRLSRCGTRIRMVRAAAPCAFPASARDYRRQQSRWLRNLFLHGLAFGNRRDVIHVVITGAVGALGLGLPVMALVATMMSARRRATRAPATHYAQPGAPRAADPFASLSTPRRWARALHGDGGLRTALGARLRTRWTPDFPLGPSPAPVVSCSRGASGRADTAGRHPRALDEKAVLVRDGLWLAWSLLLVHSLASRLRCIAAARAAGLCVPWTAAMVAAPMAVVDWVSWASALLELLHPARRWRW